MIRKEFEFDKKRAQVQVTAASSYERVDLSGLKQNRFDAYSGKTRISQPADNGVFSGLTSPGWPFRQVDLSGSLYITLFYFLGNAATIVTDRVKRSDSVLVDPDHDIAHSNDKDGKSK